MLCFVHIIEVENDVLQFSQISKKFGIVPGARIFKACKSRKLSFFASPMASNRRIFNSTHLLRPLLLWTIVSVHFPVKQDRMQKSVTALQSQKIYSNIRLHSCHTGNSRFKIRSIFLGTIANYNAQSSRKRPCDKWSKITCNVLTLIIVHF